MCMGLRTVRDLGAAGGACGRRPGRNCDCSESKRVDDFAAMSDEELRAYVYGTKDDPSVR